MDILKLQDKLMPARAGESTPLCGAVGSGNTELFAEVLAAIKKLFPDEPPTGRQVSRNSRPDG